MYHIHTTPAFVVNVLPSGERHQFITLFTKDFGMIRAKVQSVRVPLSKLRYALQEYSYTYVSLVKGKDIWRVVNAQPIYNIYFELKDIQSVFMSIARILSLLKRLLPEEGCESIIFDDFHHLCEASLKFKYDQEELGTLEWLFLIRTMCTLGYARKEQFGLLCTEDLGWGPEYLHSIFSYKEGAVGAINNALKVSQL